DRHKQNPKTLHCTLDPFVYLRQMPVKIIRFSPAVNASERIAETRVKTSLLAIGDSVSWFVLAGLASSSSPLHQSDDLDLVAIGPRGVVLIEVKHWDAPWIQDHPELVAAEAEKLTMKAKRLAGRVKRALSTEAKVRQVFMLTREPVGKGLPLTDRGVPLLSLRDVERMFRELPANALDESQVRRLLASLEPTSKAQVDGNIRRIDSYPGGHPKSPISGHLKLPQLA
uniref:nuclease-related domain-containing protein n=1 Tax=Gemmatimonas sp. TaxID=1962908 RepID=UPI003564A3AC